MALRLYPPIPIKFVTMNNETPNPWSKGQAQGIHVDANDLHRSQSWILNIVIHSPHSIADLSPKHHAESWKFQVPNNQVHHVQSFAFLNFVQCSVVVVVLDPTRSPVGSLGKALSSYSGMKLERQEGVDSRQLAVNGCCDCENFDLNRHGMRWCWIK